MKMVMVTMEAEMVEEQEGTILFRLKTGFGDPELRVVAERVTVEEKS